VPSAPSSKLLYLDSSALVKLIVAERETPALLEFLAGWPNRVASALARVEVLRAVARSGASPAVRRRATRVLARVALIRVDDAVLSLAARVPPAELRTLDALHLATARSLDGLAGIVTYDLRLARAASRARLRAWSPGARATPGV
jgi:predicted nucleic acid-binding protein